MSQNDNPKRRISKVCENLARQLDKVGLADKVQLRMSNDPFADLQNIHRSLLSVITAQQTPQLPEYVQNNQITMLESLKYLTTVNLELSHFSKVLYEQQYTLEVYKSFRKLYEAISNVSNSMYGFESDDEGFISEKEGLINKNLQICQDIAKPQLPSENIHSGQEGKHKNGSQQRIIEGLKQEIAELHRLIEQNDEQFSIEIQRYNNTLFDLQETVRQYEVRLDKVREYEVTIDDLQHKLIRLKEEKYRDDMLIENMSKKIRVYQKQRGGNDVFLSPRQSYGLARPGSRKNLISPSSKFVNQSAVSHMRSFMGEKVL